MTEERSAEKMPVFVEGKPNVTARARGMGSGLEYRSKVHIMRKKPLDTHKIELFKDVSALFSAELDAEQAKLKRWREDTEKLRAWGCRSPSTWLDTQVTRRHESEIRLQRQALGKLGKLLRCGALTRAGKPCQCKPEEGKRRCSFHGGKSTGPKTEAGREAIRESNRRRARQVESEDS